MSGLVIGGRSEEQKHSSREPHLKLVTSYDYVIEVRLLTIKY